MAHPSRGTCSVCPTEAWARGLCNKHYIRWRKYGDPLGGSRSKPPNGTLKAFIEMALASSTDECIDRPSGASYGTITWNGRKRGVHAVVCEAAHGPAPTPRHHAAHSCGRPICGNPRHLRWATPRENQADVLAHGTRALGERNGRAKLTEVDVRAIRSSTESNVALAERYEAHQTTISRIRQGRRWRI